jgi:hypothetical protein
VSLAQALPDLDGFCVTVPTVEEGDHLIEDIRCGNDQRRRDQNVISPVPDGRVVMLVVGCFKGDEVARVEKTGGHLP